MQEQNAAAKSVTVPQRVLERPKDGKKLIVFLNFKSKLTQKYDTLWRIMLIFTTIVSAVLFNKVYIFQTNPYFDTIRKGTMNQILLYSLPFAIIFAAFDFLVHWIFDGLCEKYYITNERYTEPQQRKKRCFTLVKWGYSLGYYIISATWGYLILRKIPDFPTWLGGTGSLDFFAGMPKFSAATNEMSMFYILQLGKHFSRFFTHVFIRPEGNYYEIALHHGLSVFLIAFSYLTNLWFIGIFVLVLHDFSDFWLIFSRAYKDYRYLNKDVQFVGSCIGFVVWIMCRIVLFSICCIYYPFVTSLTPMKYLNDFECQVLYFPCIFMIFMLSGLLVLNLFWTYYITESFRSIKSKDGKVKHTYD